MAGWRISGPVLHGRQLGRQLGFPTANLAVPEEAPVSDGVYRARVEVEGRRYLGMANVGDNPSVGGCRRRLEVHLFDYEGDLYGRTVGVELLEKIREEQRFATIGELRRQLAADRQQILRLEAAAAEKER